MSNNYQDEEFINFPKKYFNIDFKYKEIRCKNCDWSPEFPGCENETYHIRSNRCKYIYSKYNITFDKKTGEKIGSIKPEKLNLICPICSEKKYCVEGYFECEHHVCKDCYSLMKSREPIELNYDNNNNNSNYFNFFPRFRIPTFRFMPEQFDQTYIIIRCPLCGSE